jgi:hypothetical protein
MLRIITICIVLVCLLLQWIPDSLHVLVHRDEEHTEHAFPIEGELSFDVAHKHCKNPEKALNAAWIQPFVSLHIAEIVFLEFASFGATKQSIGAFDFKSGRAPPETSCFS